ncbi:hypothetical protein B0H34DRAFT_796869 [Crassisporium funariophilum]|nr:hypothetical protein B0H34DRAFT_796869 [Crassisporium funariophilum]
MAARPLQPSELEIQREVEALRDIRRRSTTPGALAIDPDLPNQSPPSSPTLLYRSPNLSSVAADNDSIGSSSEGSSSSDRSRTTDGSHQADPPNNPSDDPFHLFWVPASLHPEIAPAEFRAFLKEHARSPSESSDDSPRSTSPSSLSSSASLSRKRSMLSRQYRPKANDGVEDENIVPLKRNRSLLYPTNQGPQLTISDLQKLEELAEEASESDDPSRLRNVLRRSLSLNLSPSAVDLMDDMPEMGDEADAPIIVPPPGQILRRAARTKIRKPGLPGDGGGHRFGASRRGPAAPKPSPSPAEPRTSSEMSSSDHGEPEPNPVVLRQPTFSDDGAQNAPRPDSFSEEASIYDAYARSDEDDASYAPVLVTSPPSESHIPLPLDEVQQIPVKVVPIQPEPAGPPLHQPQPQRLLVPNPPEDQSQPSRTPSPADSSNERPPVTYSPPSFLSTTPSPPSQPRKEKDKKGLFAKWGGDKAGKKSSKEKDRENRERAVAEKEKESGFFGSLFGGKKKQDSEYSSSITGGASGREAAQALLGASKSSKSYVPPTSPGLAPGVGGNPYARYPIHVERAIYRLSHIKLANPRRPLYEQVLISNLMFWYLGVINKAQAPAATPTQPATNGTSSSAEAASSVQEDKEREEKEREQKEKDEREKAEKERVERERLEKEQRERELESKKKESGRRGSLTKTAVNGPQGGGRRAEMPIKGPQYEMQHRVMEQEYGGYNNQSPRSPTSPNGSSMQQFPRTSPPNQYSNTPPKLVQPQMAQPDQYYYQPQPDSHSQRPSLPPGAMAPADQSTWMSQPASSSSQRRNPSPNPGPHRRSHSPPSHNRQAQQRQPVQLHKLNTTSQENLADRNGAHRSPNRSLSATAITSPGLPSVNGQLRKGNSANAVPPQLKRPHTNEGRSPTVSIANGEEEDLPLAVWQQQRRK